MFLNNPYAARNQNLTCPSSCGQNYKILVNKFWALNFSTVRQDGRPSSNYGGPTLPRWGVCVHTHVAHGEYET